MQQAQPAPRTTDAETPVSPNAAFTASLCPLILARARDQATHWQRETTVKKRLALVSSFRHLIVKNSERLVATLGRDRPAESLSSEIIPLADACKFLEKSAEKILSPRSLGRSGRPFWLRGVSTTIRREPFGAVLILAPSNYPLFLPAVQTLQAVVAGNSVALKPAIGRADIAYLFSELLLEAGFPESLVQIVPEPTSFAEVFASIGFDKVVLTGSAQTGRKVLASLAGTLTPATVELSGADAVFLTRQADIDRAASAVAFGLTLNGGKTCIAPRRIFVPENLRNEFTKKLTGLLENHPAFPIAPPVWRNARDLVDDAIRRGARKLTGTFIPENGIVSPPLTPTLTPTLLDGVSARMPLAQADVFAPVASIISVEDAKEALHLDLHCPYALGASVFTGGSDDPELEILVDHIRASSLVIDDMIVPTADPRVPFGGSGQSGFGTTRGAEGLLDLTRPKVVMRRKNKWLPHLDPPSTKDEAILTAYLKTAHAPNFRSRLAAIKQMVKSVRKEKS